MTTQRRWTRGLQGPRIESKAEVLDSQEAEA